MKLVIDEKLKHRLVGVAVVLSLGAIFLPAMMKKSSQRLENNFSINVQLPPKPVAPNVVMTDEKDMFKTIKVAKLETLPAVKAQSAADVAKEDFIQSVPVNDDTAVSVAKNEPVPDSEAISEPIQRALSNAANNAVKKQINEAAIKPVKPVAKVQTKVITKPVLAKANKTLGNKKGLYAVQLASLSKLSNAQALVNKLHSKGYKANFTKVAVKHGFVYKVYAGHSPVKNDVLKLKTQLASAMQLNGFVVNTGVS